MAIPFELGNLVHDRAARWQGYRDAAGVVTYRQGGGVCIQESVTGERAVTHVVEDQRSAAGGLKGVAHHHDDGIVLIDEGGTVQALI